MTDNISKYNSTQTPSERSENARRAGIASGVARRQRAEILRLFKNPMYRKHFDNDDTIAAVAEALIRSALRGNFNAVKLIVDIVDGDAEPDIDDVIAEIETDLENDVIVLVDNVDAIDD